jgi:hypothetical protein
MKHKWARLAKFYEIPKSVLADKIYVRFGVVVLASLRLAWCVGPSVAISSSIDYVDIFNVITLLMNLGL